MAVMARTKGGMNGKEKQRRRLKFKMCVDGRTEGERAGSLSPSSLSLSLSLAVPPTRGGRLKYGGPRKIVNHVVPNARARARSICGQRAA